MNKTREQIINSMCMTWQHDYGLLEDHEKNVMFSRMAQIFDHEVASELMMQSDCDNYEEEAEEMRDKIELLEQQVKELNECTNRMLSKEKALIHHMINKKQHEICKNCIYHGESSENGWGVCSNTDSWLYLEDTPYHATCKYWNEVKKCN